MSLNEPDHRRRWLRGRQPSTLFHRTRYALAAIMRTDGDLRDRDTVMRLFEKAPKACAFFTWPRFSAPATPNMKAGDFVRYQYARPCKCAGSLARTTAGQADFHRQLCTYPSGSPMDESLFGTGPLHDSARAYGLAKMALARDRKSMAPIC